MRWPSLFAIAKRLRSKQKLGNDPCTCFKLTTYPRTFGSTKALIGASLDIAAGEIVALMGANGAGKSTLVKILSGVDQADAGTITLRGKDFAPQTPAEAKAAGIVTVHQSTDVVGIPGLTVADALLLNRYVDGRSPFFLSHDPYARRPGISLTKLASNCRWTATLPIWERQNASWWPLPERWPTKPSS